MIAGRVICVLYINNCVVLYRSSSRKKERNFKGVPGTAGRDFPTLGSIPITR